MFRCVVKSEGNCPSHMTAAVTIIAQYFIGLKKMFDRSIQKHIAIVIIAKNIWYRVSFVKDEASQLVA